MLLGKQHGAGIVHAHDVELFIVCEFKTLCARISDFTVFTNVLFLFQCKATVRMRANDQSAPNSHLFQVEISLCGNSGAGKTTIGQRFLDDTCDLEAFEYRQTGDLFSRTFDDLGLRITLVDGVHGGDRYRSLSNIWFRKPHQLIVCDPLSEDSFRNLFFFFWD